MKLTIARRDATRSPAKIVVVPDPHVRPGQSLERFRALAREVIRQRPTHVVWIGDLWDFPSLDKRNGAKSRGGSGPNAYHGCRTAGQDIDAGKAAMDAFEEVIRVYNARQKRSCRHDKVVEFVRIFCVGNHEMRIEESGVEIAEFRDMINFETQIGSYLRKHHYHVIPFLEAAEINGVFFQHYFKSGSKGDAVQMPRAIAQIGRSAVWGHTHTVAYAERLSPQGWDKFLCIGTFMDEYTLEHHHGASSGIVVLDDVLDGDFSFQIIPTHRLLNSNPHTSILDAAA